LDSPINNKIWELLKPKPDVNLRVSRIEMDKPERSVTKETSEDAKAISSFENQHLSIGKDKTIDIESAIKNTSIFQLILSEVNIE
jgi:hypothetical protein